MLLAQRGALISAPSLVPSSFQFVDPLGAGS